MSTVKESARKLQEIIDRANHIVFFGGAGVSTESGIPDFRSQDGLFNQEYAYPPETIVSHSFFKKNPEEFYRFYKEKLLILDAKPNMAHKKLAELEQAGKLLAIITQNIDGLHQKAGSKTVYELHGSIHRNYCTKCHKFYTAEEIKAMDGVPTCTCGGIIRPDIVLYGESLPNDAINGALKVIQKADCIIIGGTSLVVYPATDLLNYFEGNDMVIINKSITTWDRYADPVIREPIGEVFANIHV